MPKLWTETKCKEQQSKGENKYRWNNSRYNVLLTKIGYRNLSAEESRTVCLLPLKQANITVSGERLALL
jgi:hypothetical protein